MARKATAESAANDANAGRLKQIALTYKMTRKADSKIGLVIAGVGIVVLGVFLAIGFLLGHPVYLGILGLLVAVLAMAIVFGRRAERAAFGQMEGQPGAAAAVLPVLAHDDPALHRLPHHPLPRLGAGPLAVDR
ncbi:DUF4191 family protein, partial [Streptomyces hundungensis]|uniref:DUF4191 family protein n=1 Tax=Streptomyces hundungensis TaxID=1077946 RepID=UPI003400260E